ncbi:MAG: N-acetylmuramoyl-L-alanine amidase, partial [Chthonomonas sp.]|nr:N-acetylmuramoyl-L-alanine amidase [Chthonomonas sp.]
FYGNAGDTPLARMVQNAIVGATGGKNRGIKSASQTQHGGLAIMKFGGPCCLCELGFIDNAKDRVWLQDKDTRIKFAKAVAAGFVSLRGH